jgi:hypothetical protein
VPASKKLIIVGVLSVDMCSSKYIGVTVWLLWTQQYSAIQGYGVKCWGYYVLAYVLCNLLCDSADFHDYHHRLLYTKSGNYSSTFTYMDWWELSPFLQSFADCSNQPNFFSYFCLSHIFFSDHRSCSWWLTCTPFSGVSHLWGNSFVLCLVMLLRFSVKPCGFLQILYQRRWLCCCDGNA